MCGIVGAVGLDRAPPDEDAILGTLRHRGPDSPGRHFRDGVWLGVTRLRILDLRHVADQPLVDERSGTVVVFNGEIYNFVELRRELESRGHSFATTGDTEVLLRGYLEWGDGVFERCNGMWAAAIDDPSRDGVLLSRDRFGEKPLFVGRDLGGAWWFASEPATLRCAGAGTGRLDLARAAGFLLLGDVEDPASSYFDGIVQLPPASWATLTRGGLSTPTPWWDLAGCVERSWDGAGVAEDEVLEALDAAVRLRLRSDVPVGTSLSGGVDSSAVVGSIRAVDPAREIHAFTATFPGQAIDESPRAAAVADRFGATLHRVEPTADGFLGQLDRLVERQGGPVESPSVYAQWCVMQRAADEGVVVLLDGQGADETWGGYLKYLWFKLADDVLAARPLAAGRTLRTWRSLGDLPRGDPRQVAALAAPPAVRRRLHAAVATVERRLGPALRDVRADDPQGGVHGLPLLEHAAVADGARVILPRLLRYADRNSMAWSRELRLPYLDPALVALAFRSGWERGLAGGWTKSGLRRAAARRLPPEIVWRREKTAYQTPDAAWLRHPPVAAAVDGAAHALHELGILRQPSWRGLSPWRVLSLARLIERAALTV